MDSIAGCTKDLAETDARDYPLYAASTKPKGARPYYLANAFYGAPDENPQQQRRNMPRRFFHLMIWGGPVPDGALQLGNRADGRLLQRPVDGHRGQPCRGLPYWLGGGGYGDHYTFVRDAAAADGRQRPRVGPKSRTLGVLRALVGCLRPA